VAGGNHCLNGAHCAQRVRLHTGGPSWQLPAEGAHQKSPNWPDESNSQTSGLRSIILAASRRNSERKQLRMEPRAGKRVPLWRLRSGLGAASSSLQCAAAAAGCWRPTGESCSFGRTTMEVQAPVWRPSWLPVICQTQVAQNTRSGHSAGKPEVACRAHSAQCAEHPSNPPASLLP